MSTNEIPSELTELATKMRDEYTKSEYEIAIALAKADSSLSIEEIATKTGYTERTIKKRVGTLEEALGGEPLIGRDGDDNPRLHWAVAEALLGVNE